jgi:hypothetical protein
VIQVNNSRDLIIIVNLIHGLNIYYRGENIILEKFICVFIKLQRLKHK